MPPSDFHDLLRDRRVVICVGAGGVGKTSVTAALSIAAARNGRRVLALTVDPALRLAESLGVRTDTDESQPIVGPRARALGIPEGALKVMMLDPARSWNQLIERTTPDEAARQKVLSHPLYRVLIQYLAGAQEYMAMEKLLSVLDETTDELIVLDTPPSRHALDFLTAPERLSDAVEGAIMRALARGVEGTGRFGFQWLSKGVALAVRTLGQVLGASMLEDLATLVAELNRAIGGLRERAGRVSVAFRDPSFAYVLVSRPVPSAVEDTLFFEAELGRRGLRADGVVLNCCRSVGNTQTAASLDALNDVLQPALLAKVQKAHAQHRSRVGAEVTAIETLERNSKALSQRGVRLAAYPSAALGATELAEMASTLSRQRG